MAGTEKLLIASTKVRSAAVRSDPMHLGNSTARNRDQPRTHRSASMRFGCSRPQAPETIRNVMGHRRRVRIHRVPPRVKGLNPSRLRITVPGESNSSQQLATKNGGQARLTIASTRMSDRPTGGKHKWNNATARPMPAARQVTPAARTKLFCSSVQFISSQEELAQFCRGGFQV
ncbi:hypothetical protein SDC9_198387 [bioreactor metagenome]|uniref:Uncharacterized protein n=1 Tax=bioreactor metagenome TaxID=1076179 RepID=A0A645IQX1_9ZZZZ